jgi:hypothetical protein
VLLAGSQNMHDAQGVKTQSQEESRLPDVIILPFSPKVFF